MLEEALGAIEDLYNYRLAERLGRFVSKEVRQGHIDAFAKRMVELHHKMYRIRSELAQGLPDNALTKSRGIYDSVTTAAKLDWKKSVRLIERRYNEVLAEGSFKFCKKICNVLGLEYSLALDPMVVEDWADECLESRKGDSCC